MLIQVDGVVLQGFEIQTSSRRKSWEERRQILDSCLRSSEFRRSPLGGLDRRNAALLMVKRRDGSTEGHSVNAIDAE
jgi:hypothetical protein